MSGNATPGSRHVITSGGSRGLGQHIVTGLLDAGYSVSTFSRTASPFITQLASNERFFFSPVDLAEAPAVSEFLKTAESKFGPPYGLINCAAIAVDGLLATMPDDSFKRVLSINGEGTIRLTKLVVRKMLGTKKGGVILNISSISSIRGFKGMAAYAFSKGGLDAFTRALARELGSQKIRVNSIAPGYYDTEMSHKLSTEHKEQILRRTPLGRLGEPADVVGAVLFFLSDQASFITGQLLVIDGGSTI